MNDFYNESTKKKYLSIYKDTSQIIFSRLFRIAHPIENKMGCDIYNFGIEQFEELMKLLKPATEISSRNTVALLSSYVNWAIQEGLRTDGVNPLLVKNSLWYKNFVTFKSDWTEKEFEYLLYRCKNAQDVVILCLLFEGVNGDGFSEILQLSKEDVNFEKGILTLTNLDRTKRQLQVSKRTLEFIDRATREFMYEKRNGHVSPGTKSPWTMLAKNNFIIRNSITRNENIHAADKYLVYRRLKMLSDVFQLPLLNANMIERSGMLKMAKDLLDDEGKLEREQLLKIAERFNLAKRMNNGTEEYNYYPLKQFITVEKIKDLYKLE